MTTDDKKLLIILGVLNFLAFVVGGICWLNCNDFAAAAITLTSVLISRLAFGLFSDECS